MERGRTKGKFQSVGDIVPDLVRKYKTFRPTELAEKILADYNTEVTPESITMFFKRHPETETQLRKEVIEVETEEITVSESIFENGTFEELPSIKKWIIEARPRIAPDSLEHQIGALKQICRGVYSVVTVDEQGRERRVRQTIPNWHLKSPERLTLEHAKEYISYLHGLGKNTHEFRLAARAFFLSRDRIKVSPTDISGDKGDIGKYGKVVATKDELHNILSYIKEKNFDYYVADHTSYKTATRLNATLESRKSNMIEEGGVTLLEVVDKGLHRKGRQKWLKIIPPDLRDELLWVCEKNGDDLLFKNVDADDLRELNKEAYRKFLQGNPKALELGLKEPFHFWRHMFAQHMLRATNWNYDIVAELGGWSDTNTLKKCYGSPPTEVLRKAGITYIPTI